ncbi:MAG: MEDS domain-containing protein [Deltaproteobacteria bacterium]|nr:MEDS domain-containing protein [Deltaproteobacteria bacterium]
MSYQINSKRLEQRFENLGPGDHLCHFYDTEEEHRVVFEPFIRLGLEREEKVMYVTDNHTEEDILNRLEKDGVDIKVYQEKGQLVTIKADDLYTKDGFFSPFGMIQLLQAETLRALDEGYSALRITGEATWSLKGVPGSQRLIEYEEELNHFFPGSKCLAICQYPKNRFKPRVLMDVMAAHPIVIIGTEIFNNFYYESPGYLQGRVSDDVKLNTCLNNLLQWGRTEEKIKKIEAESHQAQKMEAVRTLAGGIAHDFNNLLMGIQGRASLMMLNTDAHHPNFEHLKGIEECVMRAAELAGQLLDFSKIEFRHEQITDLNIIMKRMNRVFEYAEKHVVLHEMLEEKLWPVKVDQPQIEQVISNIYTNAAQAMSGKGNLDIRTENVVLNRYDAMSIGVEMGEFVKISIADTGIGMDEKILQRIFEPFFSTKKVGRGIGLGLASAYSIIRGHHGAIKVFSKKGKGSKFDIYLPAINTEIKDEFGLTDEILRGSETILLVDDEGMIIHVGKEIIERMGYRILTANSGKEALEIYEMNHDRIDLVILDMVMPEMGGGEVYDRMKSINPHVQVLLSSGYSIEGEAQEILKRGCNGFIQKPFGMEQLSQKIRGILDKKISCKFPCQ